MASSRSPEFRAFARAKIELAKQLSFSLTFLKDECMASVPQLLSFDEERQVLGGYGSTPTQDTSKLLDVVLTRIRLNPSAYYTFKNLSILQSGANKPLARLMGETLLAPQRDPPVHLYGFHLCRIMCEQRRATVIKLTVSDYALAVTNVVTPNHISPSDKLLDEERKKGDVSEPVAAGDTQYVIRQRPVAAGDTQYVIRERPVAAAGVIIHSNPTTGWYIAQYVSITVRVCIPTNIKTIIFFQTVVLLCATSNCTNLLTLS